MCRVEFEPTIRARDAVYKAAVFTNSTTGTDAPTAGIRWGVSLNAKWGASTATAKNVIDTKGIGAVMPSKATAQMQAELDIGIAKQIEITAPLTPIPAGVIVRLRH